MIRLLLPLFLFQGWVPISGDQTFEQFPEDISVIEHESVVLRCKIRNLTGTVQWTRNGFAMGYTLNSIRSYCRKCEPYGDTARGEYHLKVKNVELTSDTSQNNFECQVTPDPSNPNSELRASAHINVLVPPKEVSLEPGPLVEMKANFPSKLTCRAWDTNPQVDVVWLLNGRRMEEQEIQESVSKGRRTATYDTECTLIFTPKPEHDGSTITCRVEQKHPLLRERFIEKHSKIKVYYPPKGPIIDGYNKNKVYQEGDQINITCQALGGNPIPTVHWYKGTNNTKQDVPYQTKGDMTYSTLSLRASSRDHGSVYTCQAWNNITDVSVPSYPVYLNISFSPDDVELEGPDFVEFGKNVTLTCKADNSNPPAKIVWSIDGEISKGTTQQDLSGEGGYQTTSRKDIFAGRTDEKITVFCSATAAGREKKVSKVIRIKRPPEKPVITGFPRHTVREGDILDLECRSQNGSPLPELEWRKEGLKLQNQTFQRIEGVYSSSKLRLKITRLDNQAEYSCQATNGVNFLPAVHKEKFMVYFPPLVSKVRMTKLAGGPTVQEATAGEGVELHCLAESSNPGARFDWTKNGVQVLSGVIGGETPGKNGGKVSQNVFKINNGNPVRAEDNGVVYTCISYNPTIQGRKLYQNFTLSVRYKPQFSTDVQRVYSVREGQDLTVELTATGNPNIIKYSWHNSINLPPRIKFLDGRMTIRRARKDDAGEYILFASNIVGKSQLGIRVDVTYPARILSVSSRREVEEGDAVTVYCKVDANPLTNTTVRWRGPRGFDSRHDGRIVNHGSNFTLTIDPVHKVDRGVYRCVAENSVQDGEPDTKDTEIQVHFAPEIRKFARFSKFSEKPMFPVKIPCYAYGFPEVSIYWQKEEEGSLNPHRFSFPANGKATEVESGTWLSELEINPVENSDFTKYRCLANNSLGVDSHVIRMVHNSEPDPITRLEVKQFENRTVRLRWEPGFNGGFDQQFYYRVREVSTDRIVYEGMARHEDIEIHQEYIEQYIILDRLGDYAFSIKSRNVQGDSNYSKEQFESLKAEEVMGAGENKLPRVVIVAIVLGSILVVIIKLIVITCCVKQRKEAGRRDRDRYKERHGSTSSRTSKSMMIERYPPKYSTTFGGDLYLSPPSQNSGSSYSDQDYKHLGRSLSAPGDSEGHTSYTSCSVHGTLRRQISSGIDTTLEDDVFDDLTRSGNIHHSGSIHHPPITADRMLRSGRRSRTNSLSSPCNEHPPPRLGISGLYTDYAERRKLSGGGGSLSPPQIPSPPPPIDISTLGRRLPMPPPPPFGGFSAPRNLGGGLPNGHPGGSFDKPSALEMSHELSRRIHELGSTNNLDPPDSMAHLHLDNFPQFPQFNSNSYSKQNNARSDYK